MATESTEMETNTYRVHFNFAPVGGCAREVLEEKVVSVLDALDEHTPESVTGAFASGQFDPPALEIDVTVEASSLAELHHILGDVLQVLDEHAGLRQLQGSFTESARPERDLALA